MGIAVQRNGVRVVAFNKCGHTSIVNTLKCSPLRVVERSHEELEVLVGRDTSDWPVPVVTVAYLRHPLARIASVYRHLIRDTFREQFTEFGMTADMTFQSFCDRLAPTNIIYDDHLKPQMNSLDLIGSEHRWLARLEDIESKWLCMVNTFDMDCTPRIAHINHKEDYCWPLYYSRHSATQLQALRDLYEDDMERWEDL